VTADTLAFRFFEVEEGRMCGVVGGGKKFARVNKRLSLHLYQICRKIVLIAVDIED